MKKKFNVLTLLLSVVSGLVFNNCEFKDPSKPSKKVSSMAEWKTNLDQRKKWETSPEGIRFQKWEISPTGKKVHASYNKIKKSIKTFTNMEAVVTSMAFQRPNGNPSSPKWLIVQINGDQYMMQFAPRDFQRFKSLKLNDQIIVRSRSAGFSHNHPYLILSGDYIARNNEVLFRRDFSNKGC